MSYVMILGRGLSGLSGAGNQRGMRDGLSPHFPYAYDGMFREFATPMYDPNPLVAPAPRLGGFRGRRAGIGPHVGGLGAESAVPATIEQILQQLVDTGKSKTQEIVSQVGLLSRGAAREFADNIVNPLLFLQQRMLEVKDGKPFYARHPDVAKRLIKELEAGLQVDIAEFIESARGVASLGSALSNILGAVFESLLGALEEIIRGGLSAALGAASKSPLAAVAVAGAVGLFLAIKFL